MVFEDLAKERLSIELNNSDTSVLYTGTRRRQAINDAAREFAALTECYVRYFSISVVHDQSTYTLSTISDFARLAKDGYVEYWRDDSNVVRTIVTEPNFSRRDLVWTNRFNADWRNSTTPVLFPPDYHIQKFRGRLRLGLSDPPLLGSSEYAWLYAPYVAHAPTMSSTGDVPYTDTSGNSRDDLTEYHPALPHFAAYKLLPLIGDKNESAEQLQKFLGYVARYKDNDRPKGGTHVTMARSYMRESMRRGGGDQALDRSDRWRWR